MEEDANEIRPNSMKRAKGEYTNETPLILALENQKIKPLVQSVAFDKNKKQVYINLKMARNWDFWQQLVPLILHPRPWACRESAASFALRKSLTYFNFEESAAEEDYKATKEPLKKSKTFPSERPFAELDDDVTSNEETLDTKQHSGHLVVIESIYTLFTKNLILTVLEHQPESFYQKGCKLWDKLKSIVCKNQEYTPEQQSWVRTKNIRKLKKYIVSDKGKKDIFRENARSKLFRTKTRNIADNWIQAMNEGCSLMDLIGRMLCVRNVKWTCDFLRAHPQLKQFYTSRVLFQISQKMSQVKKGEEKYTLY